MKRTMLIAALIFTLAMAAATAAAACGDDKVSKFVSIAVDRCSRRDVTITFDRPDGKDRMFVTIDREDGRRLYLELQKQYGN